MFEDMRKLFVLFSETLANGFLKGDAGICQGSQRRKVRDTNMNLDKLRAHWLWFCGGAVYPFDLNASKSRLTCV